MSGAPLIALHLLLLGLGAILVGKHVYRETHPQVGNRDSLQSRRVATATAIALFLLMVLLVLQADLGLFQEPIR
jgi:uncharacterized membrane protein YidH (DUF202 family)